MSVLFSIQPLLTIIIILGEIFIHQYIWLVISIHLKLTHMSYTETYKTVRKCIHIHSGVLGTYLGVVVVRVFGVSQKYMGKKTQMSKKDVCMGICLEDNSKKIYIKLRTSYNGYINHLSMHYFSYYKLFSNFCATGLFGYLAPNL